MLFFWCDLFIGMIVLHYWSGCYLQQKITKKPMSKTHLLFRDTWYHYHFVVKEKNKKSLKYYQELRCWWQIIDRESPKPTYCQMLLSSWCSRSLARVGSQFLGCIILCIQCRAYSIMAQQKKIYKFKVFIIKSAILITS